MALLYGRAGDLTSQNGGFRPGQLSRDELDEVCRDAGHDSLIGAIEAAYARFGKVARHSNDNPMVDIRDIDDARLTAIGDGVVGHVVVTFSAGEITDAELAECVGAAGVKLPGVGTMLRAEESRAGKFAAGVSTISLPGKDREDLGTVSVRVLRTVTTDACPIQPNSDGHAHPYVRVTSRQKHLRHGGHHVNFTTRPGMDDPTDDSTRKEIKSKIKHLKREKTLLADEINGESHSVLGFWSRAVNTAEHGVGDLQIAAKEMLVDVRARPFPVM
jgi:hypothetical protein